MTIQNLKELSKLIDLCRKKGIDLVEIDNIKLKLGPVRSRAKSSAPELQSVPDYTEEDVLNWSASPFSGVG